MTKLIELIARVDKLDTEDVIFARPEWRCDSDAAVFQLTEDYRTPAEPESLGLKYFLEVDLIRQILAEFRENPAATLEEKCNRIIHYAIYDA